MKKTSIFLSLLFFSLAIPGTLFVAQRAFSSYAQIVPAEDSEMVLANRVMPLTDRYAVPAVNDVFRDNILLTIRYMSGEVKHAGDVNWGEVRKPFRYELILQPGEVFAFHDDVLAQYQGKKLVTTNAHFNAQEGFIFSGLLYGDGVCHLASLINWAAKDAGLKVDARVNHDFAVIPDVPREYGTSIITDPIGSSLNEQMQNLYIENTLNKSVTFIFEYKEDKLTLSISSQGEVD